MYSSDDKDSRRQLPGLRCPCCGCQLVTVEGVSSLTGVNPRTIQRRLDAGQYRKAVREGVPGANSRWLIPLDEVERLIAILLPPKLEAVIAQARLAHEAASRQLGVVSLDEVSAASRGADEHFHETLQRSREANDLFGRLQGWQIDKRSAPLIMQLQLTGIDFRAGLYAHTPEERMASLDHLIVLVTKAIDACQVYLVK